MEYNSDILQYLNSVCLKDRQGQTHRALPFTLVHSPNACNSSGLAQAEVRKPELSRGFPCDNQDPSTWCTHLLLPRVQISRKLWSELD